MNSQNIIIIFSDSEEKSNHKDATLTTRMLR